MDSLASVTLIGTDDPADIHAQLRYVLVKGRRVQREGSVSAAAIRSLSAGAIRAAMFAPQAYLERNRFAVANPRLLGLRLRRHIEEESVFNEAFRLRHRAVKVDDDASIEVDMVAVAERDVEGFCDRLAMRHYPVHALVTVETAIAALIAQACVDPVIVLWTRGRTLLGLLVHNGGVLMRHVRQVEVVDERDAGLTSRTWFEQAEVMANGLRVAARRMLHGETVLLLPLGDLDARLRSAKGASDDLFLLHPDNRADALRQDLERLFVTADPRQITRYPEIFGLAFVDRSLNLLAADYRHHVRALSWARPVVAAAAAMGIVAAGSGMVDLYHARQLEVAAALHANEMRAQAERLSPPSAVNLDFDAVARVVEQQRYGLRIDRFLAWLANDIPQGITLTSVDIRANPSKGMRDKGAYTVALVFKTSSDYAKSEQLSNAVLSRLAAKTRLLESSFTLTPQEGGATLHASLDVRGENF